jgi:hypothetical protein
MAPAPVSLGGQRHFPMAPAPLAPKWGGLAPKWGGWRQGFSARGRWCRRPEGGPGGAVGAKLVEGAGQAGLDRADRDAEHVGRLDQRIAEPMPKDDDRPMLRREPCQRRHKLEIRRRGLGLRRRSEQLGRIKADQTPLAAREVKGPLDHDSVQPGGEGTAPVEAAQVSDRTFESILGHVIGQGAIGGRGQRPSPGPLPVSGEELGAASGDPAWAASPNS